MTIEQILILLVIISIIGGIISIIIDMKRGKINEEKELTEKEKLYKALRILITIITIGIIVSIAFKVGLITTIIK